MGFNWQTILGLLTTVAGAGILAKVFFSVTMYERGTLFRLGKPVYKSDKRYGKVLRILLPGRPGVWVPFVYKLIKISVAIRVRATEDMEMMRWDPEHGERQAWICKAEINYRVQTNRARLTRAMTRANDLDQTVQSVVQDAIRQVLYENHVGTLESSFLIHAAAKENCKRRLNSLGVSLSRVNVFKLRQLDATILANALNGNDDDGQSTTLTAIQQIV